MQLADFPLPSFDVAVSVTFVNSVTPFTVALLVVLELIVEPEPVVIEQTLEQVVESIEEQPKPQKKTTKKKSNKNKDNETM